MQPIGVEYSYSMRLLNCGNYQVQLQAEDGHHARDRIFCRMASGLDKTRVSSYTRINRIVLTIQVPVAPDGTGCKGEADDTPTEVSPALSRNCNTD